MIEFGILYFTATSILLALSSVNLGPIRVDHGPLVLSGLIPDSRSESRFLTLMTISMVVLILLTLSEVII